MTGKLSCSLFSTDRRSVAERWRNARRDEREAPLWVPIWYAKALRHLLVQYKESVGLVIRRFLNKLPDSPSDHEEEAAFIFQPKATCSIPQTLRVPSSCDLSTVEAAGQRILACLIRSWLMTSLSVCVCVCVCVRVSECVCSLRRLQTGLCCLSFTAHTEWQWRKQKPLPWGEMVLNHALSCCYWNMVIPVLALVCLCYSARLCVLNTWFLFLFVPKLCYLYRRIV